MSDSYLDAIERKLLNLVQGAFPLSREPYASLGQRLGIDGDEVTRRIEQLKRKGIVRQIGPVFDARSLGYQTTLVAMQVAEDKLAAVEKLIAGHTGVSHGYERDHHFNLWFTLLVPATADIETELAKLANPVGTGAVMALPATRIFKIGAHFDMGDGDIPPSSGKIVQEKVALSLKDRAVINHLEMDIPLIRMPFEAMAERAGLAVEDFLAQCQSLQERGVVRRFGAFIDHNRAGFKANAMTCFIALPQDVDAAGRKLASRREVSHCYERKTNALWRYNLFAMIHGHTKEVCQEIVNEFSHETGLTEHILLYSTREFKKVRIKYRV